MNNCFWKKNFVRKKISQNVFWINWGSGEHERKFLKVERGEKGQKLRQESEQFERYKIGSTTQTRTRTRRTVFFLIIFVFLATEFRAPLRLEKVKTQFKFVHFLKRFVAFLEKNT